MCVKARSFGSKSSRDETAQRRSQPLDNNEATPAPIVNVVAEAPTFDHAEIEVRPNPAPSEVSTIVRAMAETAPAKIAARRTAMTHGLRPDSGRGPFAMEAPCSVPDQREKDDNRNRNTDQPKQNSATHIRFLFLDGRADRFALGRDARFTTIIPAGASPYPMPPGDPMMPMLKQGVPGVKSLYGSYLAPAFDARLEESDMEALMALRRRRFRTAGFEASLSKMIMPCLLYAGDADPVFDAVKAAAASMPNASFFSLPGYGHLQAMMESHAVLPRVMEFLRTAGG
jgi:hypothetical protein